MTAETGKQILVTWANAQIGTREGANNWNKYAQDSRLQQLYGWNAQNQPWCDLFTDAGFICCFGLQKAAAMTYQPIGAGSAACRFSALFFKQNGAWYQRPEICDVAFFYVGGEINHQGIVTEVRSDSVVVVEGNASDMVSRRTYALASPQIAGYGRPKWEVLEDLPEDMPPDLSDETPAELKPPSFSYYPYVYSVRVNLLIKGSYGPQVRHMQQLLAAAGFGCEISGVFDEQTETALRAFQTAAGIGVDGEFGGESFNALWNYESEEQTDE